MECLSRDHWVVIVAHVKELRKKGSHGNIKPALGGGHTWDEKMCSAVSLSRMFSNSNSWEEYVQHQSCSFEGRLSHQWGDPRGWSSSGSVGWKVPNKKSWHHPLQDFPLLSWDTVPPLVTPQSNKTLWMTADTWAAVQTALQGRKDPDQGALVLSGSQFLHYLYPSSHSEQESEKGTSAFTAFFWVTTRNRVRKNS